MPQTKKPKLIYDTIARELWDNGAATDALTKQKRVVREKDKITAQDMNELRANIEVLLNHTHGYIDAASISSGGSTTTCG